MHSRFFFAGAAALVNHCCAGQFSSINIPIDSCTACSFPLIGDLNADGLDDLIVVFPDSVCWMKNAGDSVFFKPALLFGIPPNSRFNLIGLADGNNTLDLVGTTPSDQDGNSRVLLFPNVGDSSQPAFSTGLVIDNIPAPHQSNPTPTRFADLDNDGRNDILSISTTIAGDSVDLWYRQVNDLEFERQVLQRWCAQKGGPYAPIDAEGDGDLDLALFLAGNDVDRIVLYWNIGGGRFGPFTYATGQVSGLTSSLQLAAHDVNFDGYVDLVLGGKACLSAGDGTFSQPVAPQPSISMSIADVDCDPNLEVVLTSTGMPAPVRLFELPSGISVPQTTGLPAGRRSGLLRVDGDPLLDLLIGPTTGQGQLYWRRNQTQPAVIDSFSLISTAYPPVIEIDTLVGDTILPLAGGFPTLGGYYTGMGVFNNQLYSWLAPSGWLQIIYHRDPFTQQTFACPSSATDSIYIVRSTQVDELKRPALSVFPNPVRQYAHVVVEGLRISTITILDRLGQQVMEELPILPNQQYISLTLSELSPGAYHLVAMAASGERYHVNLIVAR